MITHSNKTIYLNKSTHFLEIHRYLQILSDNITTGTDELSIVDSNPSIRITDDMFVLLDGWHLDASSIKYISGGAWNDCLGKHDRLDIIGSEPGRIYTVKSSGKVTKGSISRSGNPGFYITDGNYVKLDSAKNPYEIKMSGGHAYTYAAPAPQGETLVAILKKL